eukprot:scaffold11667_cov127-Isochrysis_galbana.AAC.4
MFNFAPRWVLASNVNVRLFALVLRAKKNRKSGCAVRPASRKATTWRRLHIDLHMCGRMTAELTALRRALDRGELNTCANWEIGEARLVSRGREGANDESASIVSCEHHLYMNDERRLRFFEVLAARFRARRAVRAPTYAPTRARALRALSSNSNTERSGSGLLDSVRQSRTQDCRTPSAAGIV